MSKNVWCSIDRGARYKVYEPTNTSQIETCHRRLTRAGSSFLSSVVNEHAHLGARADQAAGRRESQHRCRIDRGEALLQRRLAQEEPGQHPVRSRGAPPLSRLPPGFETDARLTLTALLRCECRFDGRTHTSGVRAAVKVAMEKEQSRERESCIRRRRCAASRRREKHFP